MLSGNERETLSSALVFEGKLRGTATAIKAYNTIPNSGNGKAH
jgi:hypothetical protein